MQFGPFGIRQRLSKILAKNLAAIRTVEFGLAIGCVWAAWTAGGDMWLIVPALVLGFIFAAIGAASVPAGGFRKLMAMASIAIMYFFIGGFLYWHFRHPDIWPFETSIAAAVSCDERPTRNDFYYIWQEPLAPRDADGRAKYSVINVSDMLFERPRWHFSPPGTYRSPDSIAYLNTYAGVGGISDDIQRNAIILMNRWIGPGKYFIEMDTKNDHFVEDLEIKYFEGHYIVNAQVTRRGQVLLKRACQG